MASRSQIYPLARQLFATALSTGPPPTSRRRSSPQGYTPDFTNQFLSGIPASAVLATTANIAGKTGNAGYLDGNTTSFGIVGAGTAGYILFYQDTGSPATSTLILFLDTPDIPGMPQVLQGLQYFIYQNLTFGGWARL